MATTLLVGEENEEAFIKKAEDFLGRALTSAERTRAILLRSLGFAAIYVVWELFTGE